MTARTAFAIYLYSQLAFDLVKYGLGKTSFGNIF